MTRIMHVVCALGLISGLSMPVQADDSQDVPLFLQHHWPEAGLSPQGHDSQHSILENSLQPADCGTCHTQQYKDWQSTRHSRAMGPGVWGQLLDMERNDPDTAAMCWRCHTPLSEQQSKRPKQGKWSANPFFQSGLRQHGLICAGCHVRQQKHYGPPRKGEPEQQGWQAISGPHGGFYASKAFTDSRFCKGCHQFDQDGYALNGKLIENTFAEWQASAYARQGTSCQQCHMPNRRHLWRGIHDRDMTRKALDVAVLPGRYQDKQGQNMLFADLTLSNVGAGHALPTYLTPEMIVTVQLLDSKGHLLPDSDESLTIGRQVSLDLSTEYADTRIPANESLAVRYGPVNSAEAERMQVRITVNPDAFYSRFYTASLQQNSASKQARVLLQKALEESRSSSYVLYEHNWPLNAIPGRAAPVAAEDNAEPAATIAAINEAGSVPDWNSAQLPWQNWASGMRQASQHPDRKILMVMYSKTCPVCHAYRRFFYAPEVIAALEDMILIRVDVAQHPELSQRYAMDGAYIPRLLRLNAQGEALPIKPRQTAPSWFLPVSERTALLRFLAASSS